MPKLSDVLFERRPHSFATLATLQSNVDAIEAGLLFSNGLSTLVSVSGPSGWGKTHLLEAAAARLSQAGPRCQVLSVTGFLANIGRYDRPDPLLLDDVQDVIGKPKLRHMLRFQLEKRVRSGRPTFLCFTAPRMSRTIKSLLPQTREWRTAAIEAPDPHERLRLLEHMSQGEYLSLSPQLLTIMSQQLHGNGRTLSGALKRLKLSSGTWLGPSQTLKACGLLEPFFADNGEWDLKQSILRAAAAEQHRFPCANVQDLALYAMLHVANLAESDVARAAGIEPAKAYARANRFRRLVETSDVSADCARRFTEFVVANLASA